MGLKKWETETESIGLRKMEDFQLVMAFLFRLKEAGGFEEGRGVLGRNHQVVDDDSTMMIW